jgi:hypothetical protein
MPDLDFIARSHGRWNGREPAKPLSKHAIDQLGRKLEAAEFFRDHGIDCLFHDAKLAYVDAIASRDLAARVAFIRRQKIGKALPLKLSSWAARNRSDMLHDLGDAFSSVRERIDADMAATQAEDFYDIAQAKFQECERDALADKRAGIVRTHYRRRPNEVHL